MKTFTHAFRSEVQLLQCTMATASPLGVVTYDHGKIIRAFASRDYDLAARTLLEHTVIMRNILLQTHRDPGGKK